MGRLLETNRAEVRVPSGSFGRDLTMKKFCKECGYSHYGKHDAKHKNVRIWTTKDCLDQAEDYARMMGMSCFEAFHYVELGEDPKETRGWAVWAELSRLKHMLGELGDKSLANIATNQLEKTPNLTCAELVRALSSAFPEKRIRGASLSSVLCKLVKENVLERHVGGPRGGYRYRLATKI